MKRTATAKVAGDENVEELVEIAKKRVEDAKGKRAHEAKRKRTPADKRVHAVDRNVHRANESARQTDARDEVSRDSETVTAWKRPSSLEAPAPRAGFVQRWARYRSGNAEDADNLEKTISQGWSPVKRSRKSTVHELTASSQGKYGQYVTARGLILMEMPQKLANERKRFYRNQQIRMNRGIDEDLFKLDNRYMPFHKPARRTQVELRARRGRLEEVAGDEEELRD